MSSAQRTGVQLRAPEGAKRPTSPSAATPCWAAPPPVARASVRNKRHLHARRKPVTKTRDDKAYAIESRVSRAARQWSNGELRLRGADDCPGCKTSFRSAAGAT